MATIRKLKSGNYQVQIRLSGLNPISETFPTKTQAKKFAREVEGNSKIQQSLGGIDRINLSLYDACDIFFSQYRKKDTSIVGVLSWWCERYGEKPLIKIDEIMIDDELVEKSETVSNSTVNNYKFNLSSVFNCIMNHPKYKQRLVKMNFRNPVLSEYITSFPPNPGMERFLSDEEQAKLLKACRKSDWDKMYLLILMALTTGARRGELLGLTFSDIDFGRRLAQLNDTKNGKPRLLPLTQQVITELMKFRALNTLIFKSDFHDGSLVNIKKPYKKALESAKIENCRFHDLRHTAASNLAKSGATLLEIAEVLGHSDIGVTKRYAHLCTSHKAALIDRVMGDLGVQNNG